MEIKEMSIDLETYSDRDIQKCGVYKYAESDQFEILLFGVSINSGPAAVYDLACGDTILKALTEEAVTKWAFNASFERICLSIWLRRHYPEYFKGYGIPEDPAGNYLNPSSWKCSMVCLSGTAALPCRSRCCPRPAGTEIKRRKRTDPLLLRALQGNQNKWRQNPQSLTARQRKMDPLQNIQ